MPIQVFPCAWFSPGVAGQNDGDGVSDQVYKIALGCYGYVPTAAGDQYFLPFAHDGAGNRAVRCQLSGELFPISRIKRQWNGLMVGDLYYQERPRVWPLKS